jgi:hypothetical protein
MRIHILIKKIESERARFKQQYLSAIYIKKKVIIEICDGHVKNCHNRFLKLSDRHVKLNETSVISVVNESTCI